MYVYLFIYVCMYVCMYACTNVQYSYCFIDSFLILPFHLSSNQIQLTNISGYLARLF